MKKIVRGQNVARVAPLGGGASPPPAAPPPAAAPGSLKEVVAPAASRGVISKETYAAYNEAKQILAVAEQEAARIREEAEQQRQQAVREGFEQGYRKGYEEALAGLVRLEERQRALEAELEPQLVDLAVGIARKIIGSELASSPDAIAKIVAQALRTVRHQREITVRVHPDHVEELETHRQQLLAVLSRAPDLQIRADPALPPGGCVIESELGRVEADLETQLALLRNALELARGGS
ncbi:MAG: HrpE/YscL family type III secretion apparatus protein [Planctomycetota bacterium]|nr:MAG: HrpE/YscL family type III secretion apparatus protein [Planctomycetota bacterium]